MAPDSGGWSAPKPGSPEAKGLPRLQLYQLESDPAEQANVAAAHPEVVSRMASTLRDAMKAGRSTPGAPQAIEWPENWPQTSWMKEIR